MSSTLTLKDGTADEIVKDGVRYSRVGAVKDSRTNKATGSYLYQKADKQSSTVTSSSFAAGEPVVIRSDNGGILETIVYAPVCKWERIDTIAGQAE
jgi:hypothetical protein